MTRLRKEGYDELDLLPLATVRNNSLEQRLIPIEEILQASSNGKLLLDFYAKNSYLTTKHRPMLAGCIVDYLIANDIVPHREDFDIIADRVVQYFKTEDKVRLAAD